MLDMTIRILIADDHPAVRYGLRHMLDEHQDFAVVGEAATAEEAVARLQALTPDVTVLDLEMGDAHGIDALELLRGAVPHARVIIYTGFDDPERIVNAVRLGVQGYLLKSCGNSEVAAAIRVVNGGGTALQPAVATKLLLRMRQNSDAEADHPDALTGRERQVLRLLAQGRSNHGIADALYISEGTVKFHVSAILGKLGAKNRTEAVLAGMRRGMVRVAPAAQ